MIAGYPLIIPCHDDFTFILEVEYDLVSGDPFCLINLFDESETQQYLETDKDGFIRVYPPFVKPKKRESSGY